MASITNRPGTKSILITGVVLAAIALVVVLALYSGSGSGGGGGGGY